MFDDLFNNLRFVEKIMSNIPDFETYIEFSKLNLTTSAVSNSKKFRKMVNDKFAFVIKGSHPRQKDITLKRFLFPSTNETIRLVCPVGKSKDLIKDIVTTFNYNNIRGIPLHKKDTRYTIIWLGKNICITNYIHNRFCRSCPYNDFDYICRSIYNSMADERIGNRICLIFDAQKTNTLPTYIIV